MRARRGGDRKPRLGGGREFFGRAGRAGLNEQSRRPPFSRRKQKTARNGKIVAAQAPRLADDDGERARAQRLLHRGKQREGVGRAHEDEPIEIEPERREPRPIGDAEFAAGEVLGRNEAHGAASLQKSRRDAEREAERRRAIAG